MRHIMEKLHFLGGPKLLRGSVLYILYIECEGMKDRKKKTSRTKFMRKLSLGTVFSRSKKILFDLWSRLGNINAMKLRRVTKI